MTTPTGATPLNTTDEGGFLDSLVGTDSETTAMFGLELLETLHQGNLECQMNLSQAEMNHTKQMQKLLKYHTSVEKVVSVPDFLRYSKEDRGSIEANYHRTMRHMETARNKKLNKIRTRCRAVLMDLLTERHLAAVNHAKRLLEGRD